jgi:hypothetical protein
MGNAIRRGGSVAMNQKQGPHVKRMWNTEEANRILTSSRRTEMETETETETETKTKTEIEKKTEIQSSEQNFSHDELKNKPTEPNLTSSEDPTYLERLRHLVSQSPVKEHIPQGAFVSHEEKLEYFRRYYPTWYELYQARMQISQTSLTHSTTTSSTSPLPSRDRSHVGRRDVVRDHVKGRLTGPQLQQLLSLHYRNPQQHTASFLAECFQMNTDDVAQLLRWIRIPKKYIYQRYKTE